MPYPREDELNELEEDILSRIELGSHWRFFEKASNADAYREIVLEKLPNVMTTLTRERKVAKLDPASLRMLKELSRRLPATRMKPFWRATLAVVRAHIAAVHFPSAKKQRLMIGLRRQIKTIYFPPVRNKTKLIPGAKNSRVRAINLRHVKRISPKRNLKPITGRRF